MIVRRIKDDELYHHGVKGQRWGVRHDPEPSGGDPRRASGGKKKVVYTNRLKYTTGKSKGVKRREKVQKTNYNGNATGWKNSFDYNSKMKKNTVKFSQQATAAGGNVAGMQFKDQKSAEELSRIVQRILEESSNPEIANAAIEALAYKYGELEYDESKYNPTAPFMVFTNISKEDQLMPGNALVGKREVKQAKVLKENIGKNGMPSDVAEIARRTDYHAKPKEKVKQDYVSNGAPSSIKKSKQIKKMINIGKPRSSHSTASAGTNGMPSSAGYGSSTFYRKKK